MNNSMLQIKILGPGCANCKRLAQIAQRAVDQLGIEAKIEKVTDYADIMQYNILATPGMVINERLVSTGRLPAPAEVVSWLADAQQEA